jgi:hypothetical protein
VIKNSSDKKMFQPLLAFIFLNGLKKGKAHKMSINRPTIPVILKSRRRPIKKASAGKA